jgi:thioredoxin-like negative regulator of GroEL
MLDANTTLTEDDAELLESALEIAPQFADIYVTLAKCYIQWNDTETAMEVLSDAEEQLGSHPSISLLSSHINWDTGQKELALQQINTALEESPNDIPLLAQMARFLIENQQFEDSKPYIERAEIISPSHPAVWNLRKLIAENINR